MQDAHLSCVIKQTLNEDDSWNEHVLFIQLWKSIAGDIKLPENGETYESPPKMKPRRIAKAHILNPLCWEICISLLPSWFSPIENML